MSSEPASGPPVHCSRCGKAVEPGRGEYYLVDVRAVADPSPPVFTAEDLATDPAREIDRLLRRLRRMTREQLAHQVYRRRLFCLCNACYGAWIDDPFGTGRST
jgi:hypothetical protein